MTTSPDPPEPAGPPAPDAAPAATPAHDRIVARYAGRPTPPRWALPVISVLLVGLVVANNVGNALLPTLQESNPLLLMALNSRNSVLVLVSGVVDPVPYFVVGSLRLLAPDPLFYLLGFLWGERAVQWLLRTYPLLGDYLAQIEELFGTLRYPLVLIAPNNVVCLLAGAWAMAVGLFAALNVIGTVGRLALFWWVSDLFADQIGDVRDVIDRYQPWFLAATIGLVVLTTVLQTVKHRGSIGALQELEHDLDDDHRPPAP